MKKQLAGISAAAVLAMASMFAVQQHGRVTAEDVLNELATGSAHSGLTAQQAAAKFVEEQLGGEPLESRHELVPMLAICWDDNVQSVMDSLKAFGGPGSGHPWDFRCSVALNPYQVVHGDTAGVGDGYSMSLGDLQILRDRGWTFGNQGWLASLDIYHGDTGWIATGRPPDPDFRDMYADLVAGAVCQQDTLALGWPRWFSCPNSSMSWQQKWQIAQLHEFAVGPIQTATATSSQGYRPNWLWQARDIKYGAGNVSGTYLAALPGFLVDPYEITQGFGEQTDTLLFNKTVRRAVMLQGAVLGIAHRPTTWAQNMHVAAGVGPPYNNPALTMSGRFSWLWHNYVKKGRLRVVTVDELYDAFYRRPVSAAANWADPNYADVDADGQPDGWFSGNAGSPQNAKLVVHRDSLYTGPGSSYNVGYVGPDRAYGYATWNWGSAGLGTVTLEGGAASHPWEAANAVYAVFVPPGGGYRARAEMYVQVDPALHTPAVSYGDSVGIQFSAGYDRQATRYFGSPSIGFGASGLTHERTLMGSTQNPTTGAQAFALATTNVAAPGGEWLHVVSEWWEIPDHSQLLFVSLWKSGGIPANAIRSSAFFVNVSKVETP